MNVMVAGGVGEHGRNCFYVTTATTTFILDCGLMAGSDEPYPYLTTEQIKRADYLFISHSHKDHTGAYEWLINNGFLGRVITTRETVRQLDFDVLNVDFIEELTATKTPFQLPESKMIVEWGKSGHCLGSVWFAITVDSEKIVYSGDYVETSNFYQVDPLRDNNADIAILDCAYGKDPVGAEKYCEKLLKKIKKLLVETDTIFLPVPKYGRNMDLLVLMFDCFQDVDLVCDDHLISELTRISQAKEWVREDAFDKMEKMLERIKPLANNSRGIIFICDPQLKNEYLQNSAEQILLDGGKILLTGGVDKLSYSERLLHYGLAEKSKYSVHMNEQEMLELVGQNDFAEIIPFHS